MIDLNNYKTTIINFWKESIDKFVELNPDTEVSAISLYCCPWAGWITINFDTVERLPLKKRKKYYINSPGFEYSAFKDLMVDEWQQEYEENLFVIIKTDSNNIKLLKVEDDEVYNQIFFQFLVTILKELDQNNFLSNLKPQNNFMIGVQMLDSKYQEFWNV